MLKLHSTIAILLFFALSAIGQPINVSASDYLKFSNNAADPNDGKIANSHFAQGLNVVGINNDNTHRKINLWGQIIQHQNDGVNTFNGNSVFNYNLSTNGILDIKTGSTSYYRAGGYMFMGSTAANYAPYLSFNAYLKSENQSTYTNTFAPVFPGLPDYNGSGLLMLGEAGRSSLRFIQKDYALSSTTNDFDPQTIHPSLFLNVKGQVGIGCIYTDDMGPYKLAVKGGILTTRIKVSQTGPWPDYVFHKNYNLRKLDAVAAFIQQYHHLPDVPPAAQVEKDGLDIGQSQAVLLRKVEELTLYVIQLNQAVQQLQDRNKKLEQANRKQQYAFKRLLHRTR